MNYKITKNSAFKPLNYLSFHSDIFSTGKYKIFNGQTNPKK